jgi:hypothetical protein
MVYITCFLSLIPTGIGQRNPSAASQNRSGFCPVI